MAKLAIKGGRPLRRKPFPGWPLFNREEMKAITEVIKSGIWGGYSPKVRELERRFSRYQEAKYGISTVNGTVSMEVALVAAGIGPGDEVIVPPFTFVATATSVLLANAIPIFVDIEQETYNIDPAKIEGAITERTRAIIPVHLAGHPVDMDKIMEIAKRHNLIVLEDAAHAHGSEWKNKKVGAIGDIGSFSFQQSKNITAGEGGMLVTNNYDLAIRCRSYCNQGRREGGAWYEHFILGTNYRMTGFQAALLLVQLKKLTRQINLRMRNAEFLSKELSQIPGIQPLKRNPQVTRHSYHLFIFKYNLEEFGGIPRDSFIKALNAEGIPCSVGYPFPLYKNPLFIERKFKAKGCPLSCPFWGKSIDFSALNLPEAEKASKEAIWLTQNLLLGSREDLEDVVTAILKIKENKEELL